MVRRAVLVAAFSALALAACGGSEVAADDATGGGTLGGGITGASPPAGAAPDGAGECPAEALLNNAVCICGDLHDVGNLEVKSGPDGSLGSVGVNGDSKLLNRTVIDGSWATGKSFAAIGLVKIGGNLYANGEAGILGSLEVGDDMRIGGKLMGAGLLAVKGEKKVSAGTVLSKPPCGCDDAQLFDVKRAVDAAKGANDNAARGIGTSLKNSGKNDLTLPAGRYWFTDVDNVGFQTVHVKGEVSIYLDGSLEQLGAEHFAFDDDTATLDLYVSGSVRTAGYFKAGTKARPGAFRLFIGGAEDVTVAAGAQFFRGSIYAPRAALSYFGLTTIEGGVFAKELKGLGDIEVRAQKPIKSQKPCNAPGAGTTARTPEVK